MVSGTIGTVVVLGNDSTFGGIITVTICAQPPNGTALVNLNGSISGDWTLPHDLKLNFRTEAINLSNTPQFAEPGTSLTDPNFGVITNTLNDGRALRFQLRLSF